MIQPDIETVGIRWVRHQGLIVVGRVQDTQVGVWQRIVIQQGLSHWIDTELARAGGDGVVRKTRAREGIQQRAVSETVHEVVQIAVSIRYAWHQKLLGVGLGFPIPLIIHEEERFVSPVV